MVKNGCAPGARISFDGLILAVALALLAVLFMPGMGRAEAARETDLTVFGTSIISVAPDYAQIVAGYSADNADVRTAQQETAEKMDAILGALKALGVDDKDVATSNFSVDSIYSYRDDTPKIVGYRVTNNVTIIVRDIEQVADVLNAVFDAGSNQSYGLTFRSTKEGEAYREALAEAIKIAREKALIMAQAAGAELGDIIRISEYQNNYAPMPMYANSRLSGAVAEDAKGLGDTIMSGMLDISAQVELHYTIK